MVKWLQQLLRQEASGARMGYGLAIAGHVIIALFLIFGAFKRIEPASAVAIPVEIVMEKPDAPASSPPVSAPNEQNPPPTIPSVADTDKRAKAPLATLDVNGIDLPKQPGHDGGDPSSDLAGVPLPPADAELASGASSVPSWATYVAPIGPAPPQMKAREPGKDELTALKEQKFECGVKAKIRSPTEAIRSQARVIGFATETQGVALIRSSQVMLDRHINPHYLRSQQVFVETLDGTIKSAVALPAGFPVNEGDVIEVNLGHVDPSDRCQYIPNVAISKP